MMAFARGTLSDTNSDGAPDTVASATRSQSWNLDALGNWNSLTTDGTPESRTHNAQNQLTQVGSATLAFDNNGNTIVDQDGRKLRYDAWNRLTEVDEPNDEPLAEYAYDGTGRRVLATTFDLQGTQQRRVDFYHSGWQVVEEHTTSEQQPTTTAQYLWGLAYIDELICRDADADGNASTGSLGVQDSGLEQRLYAQQNANWNVTALVDGTPGSPTLGEVVQRFVYDAYGASTVLTSNWQPATDGYSWPVRFGGYRYDAETGLYYVNARYYSADEGRFISVDPISYTAGDMNLYGYCGANPVGATDPMGLCDCGRPNCPERDNPGVLCCLAENDIQWLTGRGADTYEPDQAQSLAANLNHPSASVRRFVAEEARGLPERQYRPMSLGPVMRLTATVASAFVEPLDWAMTVIEIIEDPTNGWSYAGLLPFIPSAAGKGVKWLIRGGDKVADIAKGANRAAHAVEEAGGKATKEAGAAAKESTHHVMTNKNTISKAAGGPYTPRFEALAQRRGIKLEDAMNKMRLAGHRGPHPQYNEAVYRRLDAATQRLEGDAFNQAFDSALERIRTETATPGTILNQLATGG